MATLIMLVFSLGAADNSNCVNMQIHSIEIEKSRFEVSVGFKNICTDPILLRKPRYFDASLKLISFTLINEESNLSYNYVPFDEKERYPVEPILYRSLPIEIDCDDSIALSNEEQYIATFNLSLAEFKSPPSGKYTLVISLDFSDVNIVGGCLLPKFIGKATTSGQKISVSYQ